jgi:hypothetical protein
MGSEVGYPFQGSIYYTQEATYGGGHNGTVYRFSDAVNVCRVESGDINRALRHIGDEKIADFSKTLINPRLHVEYVWQPHTGSTISDFVTRTAGDLASFCVEFGASEDRGTSSYYICKGCKCDTLNISASTGENYIITIDFSVSSVVTSSVTTETDPGAIGNTYAAFNRAGSITWGTGSYYVTKALDVTVNNNLNDYWDVGSTSKKCSIPGAKDVTGSCDISLDEGGAIHWYTVTDGTDITSIKFDSNTGAGYDVFTLNNGRWDSTTIENNVSGEGMFDSVPFTFKDITFSTS